MRLGLLCQRKEPPCVRASYFLFLTALFKHSQSELADRLQHLESWLAVTPLLMSKQTLIDESRDAIQRVDVDCSSLSAHCLGRFEAASYHEDGESPEVCSFSFVQ